MEKLVKFTKREREVLKITSVSYEKLCRPALLVCKEFTDGRIVFSYYSIKWAKYYVKFSPAMFNHVVYSKVISLN